MENQSGLWLQQSRPVKLKPGELIEVDFVRRFGTAAGGRNSAIASG